MQEAREDLSHLDEAERLYYLLNEHMLDLHEHDETFHEAVDLAEQLLLRPTLPLFQRARCHMVLACDEKDPPGAVEHAKEAVHLLDVDFRAFLLREEGTTKNFTQATLDDARRLLSECQEHLVEWEREQAAEKAKTAERMQEEIEGETEESEAQETGETKSLQSDEMDLEVETQPKAPVKDDAAQSASRLQTIASNLQSTASDLQATASTLQTAVSSLQQAASSLQSAAASLIDEKESGKALMQKEKTGREGDLRKDVG